MTLFCDRCNRLKFRQLGAESAECHCVGHLVWYPGPKHPNEPEEAMASPIYVYAMDEEEATQLAAERMCSEDPDYDSFLNGGLDLAVSKEGRPNSKNTIYRIVTAEFRKLQRLESLPGSFFSALELVVAGYARIGEGMARLGECVARVGRGR